MLLFFWQSAVFCLFSACVKLLKIRATHSSISKGLLQIEKWLWREAAIMHRLMYSINPNWNVPFESSSLLCRRHSLKCKSVHWPIHMKIQFQQDSWKSVWDSARPPLLQEKTHTLIQFKKPYKKPHSSLLKQKTKTNLIAQELQAQNRARPT